jgi:hypothetical protein
MLQRETGTGSDDAIGQLPQRKSRERFDAAIFFAGKVSFDWRNNAKKNAIGTQGAAVQKGRIDFFKPFPAVEGINTFREGGTAPLDFTAFGIGIAYACPPDMNRPDVQEVLSLPPRGVQLVSVIQRGKFSMRADKIDVCDQIPVDAMGARSGTIVEGLSASGIAQNMGTTRRDGWALPEPLHLTSQGPALQAWIDLNQFDLDYLGEGVNPIGVGAPWPFDKILVNTDETGEAPKWEVKHIDPMPFGVYLILWGRRGLDVAAGKMPVTDPSRMDSRGTEG